MRHKSIMIPVKTSIVRLQCLLNRLAPLFIWKHSEFCLLTKSLLMHIQPCLNFRGGLVKPLKGWVITHQIKKPYPFHTFGKSMLAKGLLAIHNDNTHTQFRNWPSFKKNTTMVMLMITTTTTMTKYVLLTARGHWKSVSLMTGHYK